MAGMRSVVAITLLLAGCGGNGLFGGDVPVDDNLSSDFDRLDVGAISEDEGVVPWLDDLLSEDERPVEGQRKIGLFLPLSGTYAPLGKLLSDTAQMALFDFASENVDILPFDVGSGEEGKAEAAIIEAIDAGVEVIAGPLFAHSVDAIDNDAISKNIPVVSFSSDASFARKGVFIMGYRVEEEVQRVIGYARRRGFVRYALLAPNTPYGQLIDETMVEATDVYDANYTRTLLFDGKVRDAASDVELFSDYQKRENFIQGQLQAFELDEEEKEDQILINEVRDMSSLPFDAIMIPLQGQDLVSAVAFLAFYDVTNSRVRFLGTSLWEGDELLREPLLNGSWFAAPDIALRQAFREKFVSVFQRQPPRVASIVYDTVALLVQLMSGTERLSLKRLTNPSGFEGVNGLFRLHEDGTVQRSYNIYQVQNGALEVVGRGRSSFDGGTAAAVSTLTDGTAEGTTEGATGAGDPETTAE
ncbi:MAG: penicillin-binding protein activator [Alphaproteobacteria bacterium GM202ARS2]|nr:penicillin-binding protein activator [Alphaproteobacteria bacterium GM202ARS2]